MKNRQSNRLYNWDYRDVSDYFITICVKNFNLKFGSIIDGKMIYSPVGVIAEICWKQIPIFNKHIALGEYVIMPNHMHGVIEINEKIISTRDVKGYHSEISPNQGSISTIVRTYKSMVTKHARRLGFEFDWHNRYYDHIIKNGREYQRIEDYILNNIEKWDEDRFYSSGS
ncbi:transposase [Flammeovirga yaeyamensis]|uniref:Transposase n=1 Tax=Flammeovirga yaeyamensis TaxID=367791 RepID=A0AAX1NED9_9BACT|nr:transposase [Flammeovirga yaeyamensis]MBB3699899.1 REP element-mobilizing transposase RayT [Flammeovirga yaeyamensis]NMF38305.1 transposase [Flammeovirga yaeyamensis]QWG04717.1 transposase [Flammeovirga yaeyamensis]